ncbi:lipopolysaccharide biosynthesis protein [Vibrio sp. 1F255]|uniref:lipopolysaccharide biosynthesis protein n=1 Tax=Vibrio sp. 1F255 TaxID=3230009 RepID=UPI00352BD6D0
MIKKILFTIFSKASLSLGTIFFIITVNHFFSVEVTGEYMMIISFILGASLFVKYGLDIALTRYCAIAYQDEKLSDFYSYIKSALMLIILSSIVVSVLSWFVIHFYINNWVGKYDVYIIAIIPIISLLYCSSAILKSMELAEYSALLEIGSITLLTTIVIFVSFFLGFDLLEDDIIRVLLLVSVFLLFIFILILIYYARPDSKLELNNVKYKELTTSLHAYFIPSFLHYLMQWGVVFIIGSILEPNLAGVYSTLQRFSYIINFVLIICNMLLAPKFSILYTQNKIEEIQTLSVQASNYMLGALIFVVPITIIISIYYFEYVGLNNAVVPLVILIIGQSVNVLTGSVAILLNMTGHQNEVMKTMLFSTSISIVSFYLLTSGYGLTGAVVATSMGMIIQNSLISYKVYKIIKIRTLPTILHGTFYG